MYIVVKTINGRRYRYRQRTWRESGRVRTQSQYLGPVDGEERRGGIPGFLQDIVRKRDPKAETESQERERIAGEDAERAKQGRANDLLSADSISIAAIAEIADMQNESGQTASADAESGSTSAGESEGEAGEASP